MTKVVLFIAICCASFLTNAQYDGKGEYESSRFRPGVMWFFSGARPAKKDKPNKYDRLIFDLTYNDWVGDKSPFSNHWASIGLNTNFLFDIPLTKGNTVALGVGVAHQYMNIRHNNNLSINEFARTTTFKLKDSLDLFKKNVLSGNSFSIPIELRFRKESWKHFKFHIGGKIGYQVNLLSKQVTNEDGHRELHKRYGFPDENKLIYSAHIRLGLRNWALFASYNFNTIFSNSNSTQLNHIQMGLSISLF
jgi:Outer membrane protein beta-barrel domain